MILHSRGVGERSGSVRIVLDLGSKDRLFETHRGQCASVSRSKNFILCLVLVQSRKAENDMINTKLTGT